MAFFGKTLNVYVVSPLCKGNYRDLTKYVQNFGHKISEEKRFVGRSWRRWEDNIESDLNEIVGRAGACGSGYQSVVATCEHCSVKGLLL
jgi:hypothetical protein